MILECPACHARYLVQIGLFAQGGRQVRCARCKHGWHAKLPTHIDVFTPQPAPAPFATQRLPPFAGEPAPAPVANLPAVIVKKDMKFYLRMAALCLSGLLAVMIWPIMDRQQIVQVMPELKAAYEALGFDINHSGNGLVFAQVKSEVRYDGGTMRLYVEGYIHNESGEIKLIPNIKARALGPDQHIIQSWWVEAPAATIGAGADAPFHTEINAPMNQTIANVNLEFYSQDEKGNDGP